MIERPLLLNYTKKSNRDVRLSVWLDEGITLLARAISRLDTQPDFFYFSKAAESIRELREMPQHNLSWDECCFHRASELLNLNKDKYYISYSGGIDSTAILVALLEVWPKEAVDKVVVLLSKSSIEENPTFFNRFVSRFNLSNSLQNMSTLALEPNSLLVTGELGDQLFGSVLMMEPSMIWGDAILGADYRETVPKIFDRIFRKAERGSEFRALDRFYPIVDECPFPIRTTQDFFWWFNFSQKWQFVKYRFLQAKDWDLRARYGTHIQHFYDSVPFQQWSLNNHDLKIRDTWDSYKFINKEFIFRYTKDPDQLKLKKIQSLMKTFTFNEKRIAVTSDYQTVETVKGLKDYVRLN